MIKHTFVSLLLSIFCLNPCIAQNTSNYRIINQNTNGLAYPSSSYIGAGTLSKTAREGAGYTRETNPALPKVNHGGYFGTPGDNLYSSNPDLSQQKKFLRVQQPTRPFKVQNAKQEKKIYIPDPNIPMTYSNYQPKGESDNDSEIDHPKP